MLRFSRYLVSQPQTQTPNEAIFALIYHYENSVTRMLQICTPNHPLSWVEPCPLDSIKQHPLIRHKRRLPYSRSHTWDRLVENA